MSEAGKWLQQSAEPVCRSLPDFEQRIYSPHKIAAVVAELAAQGVSASTALEGTGLDASHLTAVGTKVSYRQLDQVFRNALHLSANPAIALRAGQRLHITAYGMYGYALMSSATYTEAFAFAARYSSVIGPLSNTVFSRDDKTVTYTCEPLHWPNPAEDIYRFVVEFALSTHLTVARDLRGQSGRFSRVDLVYPAPAHAGAYEQLFECPVLFRQRSNELRCDAAWVDDPVAFADSITHAMAREMCEQLLAEVGRAGGVAADVRRLLIEQPGRYPSIEAIAEKLSMRPRALRRRLETEGTSYRDVLAEVRMRLAIEYLRRTQMTHEEIASRLGYSDAANFRHAFLRWTGKSPSEFRSIARE